MKNTRFIVREVLAGEVQKEVTLSSNPFFNIWYAMDDEKVPEGDVNVEWLIKVKKISLKNYNENIFIDGREFRFYISTSSQSKKADAWYVAVDQYDKVKQLESVVSDGFLNELEGKEVAINKDVIARLSLLFSDSIKTSIKPKIVVLKDVDYKTYEKAYILENDKLVERDGLEVSHTAFDGCGLMSPELAQLLQKEVDVDYKLSYVCIRVPRMAVKGILTTVDFIGYYRDNFVGNTDCICKVDDLIYLKDYLDRWQMIDENTIIVNESMAKWSKFYNNETIIDNTYSDFIDCLYITKYSKLVKEIATTSYQCLSALNLTKADVFNLSIDTQNFYRRVIMRDKAAVLEFLNLVVSDKDGVEQTTALVTKVNQLLTLDYEKFIDTAYVNRTLAGILDKKINYLASGKYYIEDSNFKICVSNPIDFMNYSMCGSLQESTLDKNEFYIAGEIGIRFACRYPIANFSEIQNLNIVENEEIKKYCKYDNELIVFPIFGNQALRFSGADFDGDQLLISKKEILINGVVPVERIFINTEDGKTFKCEYNDSNRRYYNVLPSGDVIGRLANASANIQEELKEVMHRYNGKLYTKQELFKILNTEKEKLEADIFASKTDEELEAEKKFRNEIYKRVRLYEVSSEEQKEIQLQRFKEHQEELFRITQLSMKAIDQVKSCELVDSKEIDAVAAYGKVNRMFYKLPDKDFQISGITSSYTPLSGMSSYIENTLVDYGNKYKFGNSKDVDIYRDLFAGMISEEMNIECLAAINDIYERFTKEYKEMVENNLFLQMKDIVYIGAELDCKSIEKEYELEDVLRALNEMVGTRKQMTEFIVNNFWDSICKCLDNKYKFFNEMYEDQAGELKGMFKSYSLKQNFNLDFGKYYKKENIRIEKKLGINLEVGTALGELDSIVIVIIDSEGTWLLNSDNSKLKVYSDSLKKAGIVLNNFDEVTVGAITHRFKASQKVIIKSINE